jgi:hypothetical protein
MEPSGESVISPSENEASNATYFANTFAALAPETYAFHHSQWASLNHHKTAGTWAGVEEASSPVALAFAGFLRMVLTQVHPNLIHTCCPTTASLAPSCTQHHSQAHSHTATQCMHHPT